MILITFVNITFCMFKWTNCHAIWNRQIPLSALSFTFVKKRLCFINSRSRLNSAYAPLGIHDSMASGGHVADQTVDSGHIDVPPGLPDGLLQLERCSWPWLEDIQLPVQTVPKMLSWIQIRTNRGSGHHPDVVLL